MTMASGRGPALHLPCNGAGNRRQHDCTALRLRPPEPKLRIISIMRNLRSKLRIMQIIRVEAARQHGWNANFGERTPGAHGDDRRPFGCRRRPLGRRAHLTGPGNLNWGGVARQRDGGYRVRPRSGPGTKEWTRMRSGTACGILAKRTIG